MEHGLHLLTIGLAGFLWISAATLLCVSFHRLSVLQEQAEIAIYEQDGIWIGGDGS